jgi:transcriptional regulator with XRE-family HTH domain
MKRDPVDVAQLRRRLMLSQGGFAERFGFSLPTVRNWEQGSRLPGAAARAYLTVIACDPERVAAILAGASRGRLLRLTVKELKSALDAADLAEAEEKTTTDRRSPEHSPAQASSPPASPAAPGAWQNPPR